MYIQNFDWYDTTWKGVSGGSTPSINTWSHWVMVRKDSKVYFYLNGSVTGSATVTPPTIVTPANMSIGYNSGYAPETFTGAIDDVRIYSRALSAAEVSQLYSEY